MGGREKELQDPRWAQVCPNHIEGKNTKKKPKKTLARKEWWGCTTVWEKVGGGRVVAEGPRGQKNRGPGERFSKAIPQGREKKNEKKEVHTSCKRD